MIRDNAVPRALCVPVLYDPFDSARDFHIDACSVNPHSHGGLAARCNRLLPTTCQSSERAPFTLRERRLQRQASSNALLAILWSALPESQRTKRRKSVALELQYSGVLNCNSCGFQPATHHTLRTNGLCCLALATADRLLCRCQSHPRMSGLRRQAR